MPRPLKEGLEYFPMDVHIDEKLETLELKYHVEGFGIYVRILQTIYKISEGELKIGEEEFSAWKMLGKRTGKPAEFIKQFIIDAVSIGLFDPEMFKLGIITSSGIKKRINEINYLRQKDRERKGQEFSIRKTLSKVKESKVNNIGTFTIPTLEEVKEYCLSRKNNVDINRWHDFYASKGWMIGKNKMKDWKAAVRTWEKDSKPKTLELG